MTIKEHEDYEKEVERLDETKEYIDQTISLVVDKRMKFKGDMREAFSQLDDMDSSLSYANILLNTKLLDSLELNFGLLMKSRNKPYFARMDIRQSDKDQDEELYIGKISLFDETMDTPMVVDWRAPIASVYYDGRLGKARYRSHGDEYEIDLYRKRQYTIEEGDLKHYVDVDISMSDTFLQATLENHASDKLKDIVSTIQAEQNDIIRADIHKPLIVQGVAGSGKTTIALHRIAYLIYTYSDTFRPDDFMIIAPNNLFLDYISGVLPELGADQVRQTTFTDLMMDIMGKKLKLTDQNSKLTELVRSQVEDERQRELMIRASAFKNSMVMQRILDDYLTMLEQSFIPDKEFILDGKVLFTTDYLKDMFQNSYAYLPYYRRIDNMRSYLDTHAKEFMKKRIKTIESRYDQRMNHVRITVADERDRREKLKQLITGRDEHVATVRKAGKSAAKEYIGGIIREDALGFYRKLMSQEKNLLGYAEDGEEEVIRFIVKEMRERLERKEFELEDLAPMAYLHAKLYGVDDSVKIKYAVIDEAQDFSDFQFYALRNILNTDRFTILGDLSQGIHMYRSIKDWTFLRNHIFREDTNYLTLLQSYRTTIEIMNLANQVLEKSPVKNLTLAKPVVRHGTEPVVGSFEDRKSLAEGIIAQMDAWVSEEFTTIAIVTKSTEDARIIHKAMTRLSDKSIGLIGEKAAHFVERFVVLPAHLAKGLEFDAVIVTAVEDTFFIRELDAKLLYVAMTRAMHRLAVLYMNGKIPYLDR